MTEADHVFMQGAAFISQIKDVIVDDLVGKEKHTNELPALFQNVAEVMRQGFLILPDDRKQDQRDKPFF